MIEEMYKKKLEVRRQLWHLLFGMILVYLGNFIPNIGWFYLILGVLGFKFGYLVKKKWLKSYYLEIILGHVERKSHKHIMPGMGMFFYLVGSGVALIFFPKNFALFGITLLAVGDSLTHIIGRYFGDYKWPWNKHKNIEGTLFAIVMCSFAGSIFIDFKISILISTIVYLVESIKIPKKWWWLDDNWYIPILSALLAVFFI